MKKILTYLLKKSEKSEKNSIFFILLLFYAASGVFPAFFFEVKLLMICKNGNLVAY